MKKRKKMFIASTFIALGVLFLFPMVMEGRWTTRKFHPIRANEYNLIFELPSPDRLRAGKIGFVSITDSIQDVPYYVFSDGPILGTNADVLFDPPTNGIRQLRVLSTRSAGLAIPSQPKCSHLSGLQKVLGNATGRVHQIARKKSGMDQ